MADLIKIAVDAMGGDNSPKKVIDGIIHNHKNNKGNFFKIFGDKNKINQLLKDKIESQYYEVIHTEKFGLSEKILKAVLLKLGEYFIKKSENKLDDEIWAEVKKALK